MKIKYSALVMGVSGKLNGSVGSHNKGGAYLRNKGVVTNPNTAAQAAVRSQFGALSSSFRSLSPTQIAAWNEAASNFPIIDRLGDVRYLTGLGLYVQLNLNMKTAEQASLVNPPAKQSFPAILSSLVEATGDAGVVEQIDLSVNLGSAVGNDEFVIAVKAAPVVPASISNVKNKMRLIGVFPIVAGTSFSQSLNTAYINRFGNAGQIGRMIYTEVYLISVISGEASVVFKGSAVITEAT